MVLGIILYESADLAYNVVKLVIMVLPVYIIGGIKLNNSKKKNS